jgi:hypothetical protein
MKAKRRSLTPAKDILLELFDGGEAELAGLLLRHTYFLSPDRIRERYEKTKSAAWFPGCVRGSRQYRKGKQKKDQSVWEGLAAKVCDNTQARLAFASFSGLLMAGNKEGRIRGHHVAHIRGTGL